MLGGSCTVGQAPHALSIASSPLCGRFLGSRLRAHGRVMYAMHAHSRKDIVEITPRLVNAAPSLPVRRRVWGGMLNDIEMVSILKVPPLRLLLRRHPAVPPYLIFSAGITRTPGPTSAVRPAPSSDTPVGCVCYISSYSGEALRIRRCGL